MDASDSLPAYQPLDHTLERELAQFSIHPTVRQRLRVVAAASGLSMSQIVETLCRLAMTDRSDDLQTVVDHMRTAAKSFAIIDSHQPTV